MALNGKNSDISNWYNGGPNLSVQPRQPITAPRPSQIPGLGVQDSNPDESRRNGIRDTDSEYVKLAKRGGQPNLLHGNSVPPATSDAPPKRYNQAYQRADWYYDNKEGDNGGAPGPPSKAYGGPPAVASQPNNEDRYESANQDRYGAGLPDRYADDSSDRYGAGLQDSYEAGSQNRYTAGDTRYSGPADYDDSDRQYYGGGRSDGIGAGGRYDDRNGGGMTAGSVDDMDAATYNMVRSNAAAGAVQSPAQQYGNERANSGYRSVSQSDYSAPQQQASANNSNNNHMSTAPLTPINDHHHHINRMVRENSSKSDMSTLLSFGYLQNKGQPETIVRQQPQQRAPSGYVTEYQEKMKQDRVASTPLQRRDSEDGMWTGKDAQTSQSNHNIRKPVVDDRPDFFRLGSREERSDFNMKKRVEDDRPDFFRIGGDKDQPKTTKPPQYGRRKASAEMRPEFFGNDSNQDLLRPAFGRMKHDQESKPDFFQIGNGQPSQGSVAAPSCAGDDLDVLNKVSGYTPSSRSNFRRKKTDPNAGIWAASPVRSGTK